MPDKSKKQPMRSTKHLSLKIFLKENVVAIKRDPENPFTIRSLYRFSKKKGLMKVWEGRANLIAILSSSSPRTAVSIFDLLKRTGILLAKENTKLAENRRAVSQHLDPDLLFNVLSILHRNRLLTTTFAQTYFDQVIACQELYVLFNMLTLLERFGFLDRVYAQTYLDKVIASQELQALFNMLTLFEQVGCLNRAYLEKMIACRELDALFNTLIFLRSFGLLNGVYARTNFIAVINHAKPWAILGAMEALYREDCLVPELEQTIFNVLIGHKNPWLAVTALRILKAENMLVEPLAQVCIDALTRHPEPNIVAQVWVILIKHCDVSDNTKLSNLIMSQHISLILNAFKILETHSRHQNYSERTADVEVKYNPEVNSILGRRVVKTYIVDLLSKHANNAISVSHVLYTLCRHGLLTDDNVKALFSLKQVTRLEDAFIALERCKLLSCWTRPEEKQRKFERLIQHADILLSDQMPWEWIVDNSFNETHFQEILGIINGSEMDVLNRMKALKQLVLKPFEDTFKNGTERCLLFLNTIPKETKLPPRTRVRDFFFQEPKTPVVQSPPLRAADPRPLSPFEVAGSQFRVSF